MRLSYGLPLDDLSLHLDWMSDALENQIGIRRAVDLLRTELEESILSAVGQTIQFEVGTIELNLQIEIASETEARGGLRAWVIEAAVGGKETRTEGHSITIPLTPKNSLGQSVLTQRQLEQRPQ